MMGFIIAQGTAPVGNAGAFGGLTQFVPILLIFAVFYFLLIRPQQKQQKLVRQMIAGAQRGDEVILTSGLHGKIKEVSDDTIQLEVANNITLKFDRNSIQNVKGFDQKKK